jgi:hypothetical protein
MRTAMSQRGARAGPGTILAAAAMLLGIVSLGYGVFQKDTLWAYAGIAVLLVGVVIESIFGIILRRRS